jgi:hypothetical protein
MTAPVSVRLDDDVHITLEVEAHRQGIGLGTLLRPRRRARSAASASGLEARPWDATSPPIPRRGNFSGSGVRRRPIPADMAKFEPEQLAHIRRQVATAIGLE